MNHSLIIGISEMQRVNALNISNLFDFVSISLKLFLLLS
jgi:hypothetical protein